jgi:hypothetical protein
VVNKVEDAASRVIGKLDNTIEATANRLRRQGDEIADACRKGNVPGQPGCFTAGTPILTLDGLRAIESIRVADLLPTTDPNAFTIVEAKTWQKIDLAMYHPDGSNIEIQMIRPAVFLERVGWKAGMDVWFDMPEMGIEGWAKVIALEKCPEIRAGPGRLVLSTFKRRCDFVLGITFEGEDKPVGVTNGHRFFSEERKQWIPAGLLKVGERIRARTGSVKVAEIKQKQGIHWVYNIEVETEHCYWVGESEILCHNNLPCEVIPAKEGQLAKFLDPTTKKEISFEDAVKRVESIKKNPQLRKNLFRSGKSEQGKYQSIIGELRIEKVRQIEDATISKKLVTNTAGKTDIDLTGRSGELISVTGGGKKLKDIVKETEILKEEAKRRGVEIKVYLDENTKQITIDKLKKTFPDVKVILFDLFK